MGVSKKTTRPESLNFNGLQVRERIKKPSRRGSKTAKNRDISDVRDSKLDVINEEKDKKKIPTREENTPLIRASSEIHSKPNT